MEIQKSQYVGTWTLRVGALLPTDFTASVAAFSRLSVPSLQAAIEARSRKPKMENPRNVVVVNDE